LDGIEGGTIQD